MVHKTVLKVLISCEKCKKKILKAVSGLEGVDKVEVDAAKGTVTVTGSADPYKVVVQIRKTKKLIEIMSIGPPPPPPKPAEQAKKPDPPKKLELPQIVPHYYAYHSCPGCSYNNMGYRGGDPNPACSIM